MSETAPVAAILPVFNGAAWVRRAVASILTQTRPPAEIIAIDDGSRDDSAAILAELSGVRLLRQENSGVAAARNTGVAATTSPFLAFLDQDDAWTPNKLALQLAALEAEPGAGFSLAQQRLRLGPGVTEAPAWVRPEQLDQPSLGYLPGTLLVRRETWEAVGPFDEAIRSGADDTEWFFRARDAGVRHVVVEEVLLEREVHAANQSGNPEAQRDLMRAVRASLLRKRKGGAQAAPTPGEGPPDSPEDADR